MRIQWIHDIYWMRYRFFWRSYALLAPMAATKSRFKNCMGYLPDLKEPKTLNEKMQYLKLHDYWKNPVVCQCTDKYAVRDFVCAKGCSEILNELYTVYDSVDEIDWEEIPQEFVLKCNHGSGGNIICYDKNVLDIEDAKKKLRKWMKAEFGLERVEYSYEGIKRKIICEKIIKTEDGKPPKDYKIFCSYGEPKVLFVASDRRDGTAKFDYFTPEWEWIPVKNGHPNAECTLQKPERWNDMLDYASKLSKDFPLVRVDLYHEFNQIIFGELTFLHYGGIGPFDPPEYDRKFGDLFPINTGSFNTESLKINHA